MRHPAVTPGWPLGVNNTQPAFALEPGALRAAVNVDIYDSGKVRRRKGHTLRVAGTSTHSLWSDPHLAVGYYVDGTTMYSFDGTTSTAVVTGLTPNQPVCYCEVHGEVFWSNGTVNGRIRNGVNGPWGVETPSANPALTAGVGALPPGRYQVTTTFRTATGEESGANIAVAIQLAAVGGIVLSGMPLPVDPSVTQRCIYLSGTNGDQMYRVATLPAATATVTLGNAGSPTVLLKTQLLQPMPAGTAIAHRNGVIYVANGSAVFHSEPMRFGLCNYNENFYQYPVKVDVLLATPDGLHICADRSYFLTNPGTPEVTQTPTLPVGGVPGTGVYLPDSTDVAWLSPRGQVIASGPKVEIVTAKHYIPGKAISGASLVREQEGLRQIITVVQNSIDNPLTYTGA